MILGHIDRRPGRVLSQAVSCLVPVHVGKGSICEYTNTDCSAMLWY